MGEYSPMTTPLHSPHRLTSGSRDFPPARACGKRSHHTRRYVTSLITLARAFDTQALDRLRHRARQPGQPGVMGLTDLTAMLLQSPPERRALLRYPVR